MKKEPTRDYVTEAFRTYAMLGLSYEQARKNIYEAETQRCRTIDPLHATTQAERAVNENAALLMDILAVEKTIEMLECGEKRYIAEAVKAVYFASPSLPLGRGDISNRVRWYSLSIPIDERTVYRWLKEARLLCAATRGLRVKTDNKIIKSLKDVSSGF